MWRLLVWENFYCGVPYDHRLVGKGAGQSQRQYRNLDQDRLHVILRHGGGIVISGSSIREIRLWGDVLYCRNRLARTGREGCTDQMGQDHVIWNNGIGQHIGIATIVS